MDPGTLSTLLGTWGYASLLLLLVLTGVGSPIPEDLLLLTAGYLVFSDVFQWPIALAISMVGVVSSDLMLYSAGRHIAWRAERGPESPYLSAERLRRVTRWFGRLGDAVILVARLTPGTRAVVFITAGIHAVRVSSFLRYDIMGAAVWVPAMLIAGHAAGRHLGGLQEVLDLLNRGAIWAVAAAGLLLVMWVWLGREESKL
jgi:membrane protein DedA with SNARE-associated domain